jgi:hypothetical protein
LVNLLLGLIALDERGEADEVAWAERIREHLSTRGGCRIATAA